MFEKAYGGKATKFVKTFHYSITIHQDFKYMSFISKLIQHIIKLLRFSKAKPKEILWKTLQIEPNPKLWAFTAFLALRHPKACHPQSPTAHKCFLSRTQTYKKTLESTQISFFLQGDTRFSLRAVNSIFNKCFSLYFSITN